jgi:dTDP-glucose 4,6-dehydratase
LGNLETTRDLNYVDNTVRGFALAAVAGDSVGRTINLGSGSEVSIGQLARRIIEMIDPRITIQSESVRMRPVKSEVERLLADNRLAHDLLGWEPTVSLDEGLIRTIDWFRGHQDQYRADVYNV